MIFSLAYWLSPGWSMTGWRLAGVCFANKAFMWEYLRSIVLRAAVWEQVLEPQVMQGLNKTAFQYNKVHVALWTQAGQVHHCRQCCGHWIRGAVRISSQSQAAQETPTQQENYGYLSKPAVGSFAHFPVISSFSFITIMRNTSQEGKVPCTLFFLTILQNNTSDRVPLCCQWYNENHWHFWEAGSYHWISWNSEITLFPASMWR